MIEKDYDMHTERRGNEWSALNNRGSNFQPIRRYFHGKKSGHTVDFYWNIHQKRKHMRKKI